MRVLLTGASGQVGTELRERLTDVELLAPSREAFDLAQPGGLGEALKEFRPDLVINSGAYTAVDRAEDEADLAMRVNGESVAAIADYCAHADIPLIQLSTDYVFDGAKKGAYLPTDSPNPVGVYGRSKLAGEIAARRLPEHLVLRISWVFSAHGNNFVKTMLRLAQTRPELGVVADQFGGPTWAGHVADAVKALVTRYRQCGAWSGGIFHFSGAPPVSWYDFANEIFSEAVRQGRLSTSPRVKPIGTADYSTRAARPANSVLDMEKTVASLGIGVPDWREGLRQVIAALRN